MQRTVEYVPCYAIESTTIKPQFEIYPPGIRLYSLRDWAEMGSDDSTLLFGSEVLNEDLYHTDSEDLT